MAKWPLTIEEDASVFLAGLALKDGADLTEVATVLGAYGHNPAASRVLAGLAREAAMEQLGLELFGVLDSFSAAGRALALTYPELTDARAEQIVRTAVIANSASH